MCTIILAKVKGARDSYHQGFFRTSFYLLHQSRLRGTLPEGEILQLPLRRVQLLVAGLHLEQGIQEDKAWSLQGCQKRGLLGERMYSDK